MQPLYVNEQEAAKLLHHDATWLRTNSNVLEQTTGFPKIDPVIGLRHREAIEEWARERNVSRVIKVAPHEHEENNEAF
jgi:hypothetical protein